MNKTRWVQSVTLLVGLLFGSTSCTLVQKHLIGDDVDYPPPPPPEVTAPEPPPPFINLDPDIPLEEVTEVKEEAKELPFFAREDGSYKVLIFKKEAFSENVVLLEIQYGTIYLGFYRLQDWVYLPKSEIDRLLVIYILDGLGNRLESEPRIYNVP